MHCDSRTRPAGLNDRCLVSEPTSVRSLRILFLGINFSGWVCPTLYEEQRAIAAALPRSVFYGPGYRYETSDVQQIVHDTFPSGGVPDAVFCYVDERRLLGEPLADAIVERYRLPAALRVFPKGLASLRLPKIAWINDFWHCSRDEWDEILLGNGFDVAFSTYCPPFSSDAVFEEFFSEKVRDRVRFVPWPRAIDPAVFRDYGLPKVHDVSVLGAMIPAFYPLRHRMHERLSERREWRYFSQPHPGYRFVSEPGALTGEAYARVLNQSRVFGSCTGKYHVPFMKLYEVLGCRSVLMCDRPHGAEFLGLHADQSFIEVGPEDFEDRLREVLADSERLEAIAAEGHRVAHACHTTTVRAAEFADTLGALRAGRDVDGWAGLLASARSRRRRPRPAPGRAEVASPLEPQIRHILDVAPKLDHETWRLWLKFGLNNRPHEDPPVVVTFPELVVLRGTYLCELARSVGASHMAEVGTARGYQSMLWATLLRDAGVEDGTVYTCDIDGLDEPIYQIPMAPGQHFTRRQLWAGEPAARFVRFTHGDSSRMAREISHPLDIVYIDGAHTLDAVNRDVEALDPWLHRRSIVVFDDCDDRFPGVQAAVQRFCADRSASVEIVQFTPALYRVAVVRLSEAPRPGPDAVEAPRTSV